MVDKSITETSQMMTIEYLFLRIIFAHASMFGGLSVVRLFQYGGMSVLKRE